MSDIHVSYFQRITINVTIPDDMIEPRLNDKIFFGFLKRGNGLPQEFINIHCDCNGPCLSIDTERGYKKAERISDSEYKIDFWFEPSPNQVPNPYVLPIVFTKNTSQETLKLARMFGTFYLHPKSQTPLPTCELAGVFIKDSASELYVV